MSCTGARVKRRENKGCREGKKAGGIQKSKNVGCHKNKSPVTEWKTKKKLPKKKLEKKRSF
jgi:hypothetical protein